MSKANVSFHVKSLNTIDSKLPALKQGRQPQPGNSATRPDAATRPQQAAAADQAMDEQEEEVDEDELAIIEASNLALQEDQAMDEEAKGQE